MFNMRIDIIRKELERRFKEVESLIESDYKEVEEATSRFIYFLLNEPATKDFVLELSRYDENFIKSEEFIKTKETVADTIETIIGEIDRSGMVDEDYKKRFRSKYPTLTNLFDLPDPDISDKYLSLDKFLQALRDFDQYSDCILNNFHHLMNHLHFLFEKDIYVDNSRLNADVIANSVSKIRGINLLLEAKLRYQAEYDSANSLHRLLNSLHIAYRFLLRNIELGEEIYFRSDAERYNGTVSESEYLVRDCRNVYHAVDKFLSSSKSKSFLISRLISYCKWIKREAFKKIKSENEISTIVEEFIFNQGYFPITRFKMGKSEPDILAVYSLGARWDNSILFELKRIGKSYSDRQLETDIGQAQDYLTDVKTIKDDIADIVYLLIFYYGETRRTIPESVRVPDNVRVKFIYVGEEYTSKLKAPPTTAKKKSPKKKVVKKPRRKK
jgi:hypothetical protein